MKSNRSIQKRLKKTPTGKILRRSSGQDHFNARANGKATRSKRQVHNLAKQDVKKFKQLVS